MRNFNEFQRLLKQHGIEGKLAIVLTEMFEFMSALNKDQDQHLKITVQLAETVANFVSLNEAMDGKLKELNRKVDGEYQGVTVRSEAIGDS